MANYNLPISEWSENDKAKFKLLPTKIQGEILEKLGALQGVMHGEFKSKTSHGISFGEPTIDQEKAVKSKAVEFLEGIEGNEGNE